MELLEGSTRAGGLAGVELEWSPESGVTVVLASAGYPEWVHRRATRSEGCARSIRWTWRYSTPAPPR